MCKSKLIFRRFLQKLTQNCVFSVNNKLVKQVEECLMGGAISMIMSGIHMNSMEKERMSDGWSHFSDHVWHSYE